MRYLSAPFVAQRGTQGAWRASETNTDPTETERTHPWH